ncbi:endolytic transglycosylase MltG [Patescibacteria group bacterium]
MNIRGLFLYRSLVKDSLLIIAGLLLMGGAVFSRAYDFGIVSPPFVEEGQILVVLKGDSAEDVADNLLQEGMIRSKPSFILYLRLLDLENNLRSGIFAFSGEVSISQIIERLTTSSNVRKITIQEGWDREDIANYFEEEGIFTKEEFIEASEDLEGYLFPDTYSIFEDALPYEVARLMYDNFHEKTADLLEEIHGNGRTLDEIAIMASLIEKESYDSEDRKMISGILWKRIDNNYPLQVDATVGYLTGKTSKQMSLEDLRIDSPYNTYVYKGLPVAPISNPSLNSIEAAIFPKESPHWFYLHDRNGNPHYARTFEEHKRNKARFLY